MTVGVMPGFLEVEADWTSVTIRRVAWRMVFWFLARKLHRTPGKQGQRFSGYLGQ